MILQTFRISYRHAQVVAQAPAKQVPYFRKILIRNSFLHSWCKNLGNVLELAQHQVKVPLVLLFAALLIGLFCIKVVYKALH